MSSYGNQTAALVLEESEREKFFRILMHDDRNSVYFVSTDASGVWAEKGVRKCQLSTWSFLSSANYYISHNGFNGSRRKLERTRQLNALFFDIDCHDVNAVKCEELISVALTRINGAAEHDVIPVPTLVVHSGRGIHLYYVLNRSVPYRLSASVINEKALKFFSDIQERLADVFEQLLSDLQGIDVDRKVFDFTRVARIPGTFNTKAGRYAQLLSANEVFYQLGDFATYCEKPVQKAPVAQHKTRIITFNPLLMSRLHKIEALQAYRGAACMGHREMMAFVFYNTAVQIYDREDAKEGLRSFNAKFFEPLDQSELTGIEKSVDTVVNVKGQRGFYVLSAKKISQLLSLTKEELLETNFFDSKRMVERMDAKRKTQEKRTARNKRIEALAKQGNMTRKQIAEAVGCSLRTVQSVLKDLGLTASAATGNGTVEPVQVHNSEPIEGKFAAQEQRLFSLAQECANFWRTCLEGVNREEHEGSAVPSCSLDSGDWSLGTPLPYPVDSHALPLNSDFLYSSSQFDDGRGLAAYGTDSDNSSP